MRKTTVINIIIIGIIATEFEGSPTSKDVQDMKVLWPFFIVTFPILILFSNCCFLSFTTSEFV